MSEPLALDLASASRFADAPYSLDTGSETAPIVDIGAYEYHCGDTDGDSYVDVLDLQSLVFGFGKAAGDVGFDPTCDFNHDGVVDVTDLLEMVYRFGT